MVIYRLEHLHESTEREHGGAKMLGCYSSVELAEQAREKYRNICGFSLYPNGFCIFKCAVEGETDCEYRSVYLTEAYIHDWTYEFEYSECIGIFVNYFDAKKCMIEFNRLNIDIIKNSELKVECCVSKYDINKMEWRDGFI